MVGMPRLSSIVSFIFFAFTSGNDSNRLCPIVVPEAILVHFPWALRYDKVNFSTRCPLRISSCADKTLKEIGWGVANIKVALP